MTRTNIANIDIEADEIGRPEIDIAMAARVAEALGVELDATPEPATAGGALVPVSQFPLSPAAMRRHEFQAVARGMARMPKPVHPGSFAWNSVEKPSDVDALVRAVHVYHSFNAQAVAISERIGANDELRRFVRQCPMSAETTLAEAVDGERRYVGRIASFKESLDEFLKAAEAVFGEKDWTISSILVMTGAVAGLNHAAGIIGRGWTLPSVPEQAFLDEFEAQRGLLANIGRAVDAEWGLNLMRYSLSALSGVRRSLFEGGTDFHSAVEALGVVEDDEDRMIALADETKAFLETSDRLSSLLDSHGYGEEHMPAIVSLMLFRRYLVNAAVVEGEEWASVSDLLAPLAHVSPSAAAEFIENLSRDTFSAKLHAVAKDTAQPISRVLLAADHYSVSRQYWIDAADRVIKHDPGVRLVDMRKILEMEPEIKANTELLAKVGVVDRDDVAELESHLEWLMAVYALPLPNAEIATIIESRGGAIQGLLAAE